MFTHTWMKVFIMNKEVIMYYIIQYIIYVALKKLHILYMHLYYTYMQGLKEKPSNTVGQVILRREGLLCEHWRPKI